MSDPESLTGRLDEAARLAGARRDVPHALALLADVARAADALGVVSANEPLREISTHALRVFFVPSLQAQLEDARPMPPGASEGDRMHARKQHVEACVGAARLFFTTATRHGALPPAIAVMLRQQVQGPAALAPAERRHLKIQLLRIEKEVVRLLDAFRSAFRARAYERHAPASRPPAPDDAFYDLLVVPRGDDEDEDEDEDEGADAAASAPGTYEARPPRTLRDYLRMLLVLHAVRTAGILDGARQELAMLQHAPPPGRDAPAAEAHDAAWRLDTPWFAGAQGGPLLGEGGKPLRPFVITGRASDVGARREAQARVFRPSHRLPTMSIDEYLAEEERRGNVVRSGGPAQQAAATPREQRAERAELDGTRAAEDAAEEARQEALRWDAYTESHKRGAGNTMNRG
ncbi:Type 2A phosphatase-associated protein 42 [Malassezia brasiliensis]|uniref:Type 2A phosphatase-associated protein 42 n=1 Tax=Malassezia brasiliensis TaxID=1821822 RepID=A0AAF0DXX5_9BASI|nr:Type 2A phosphatase-associated protein 42 [Malassezia brasiliensis]